MNRMNKDKIRVAAEIIALVSVVLSLLFVGYELRLSREQAFADSFATTFESISVFEDMVTTNSPIWRRGCLGEDLSEDEKMIFARIVVTHVNLMRTLYYRTSTEITQTNPDSFPRWVASSRYRFPGYDNMYRGFSLHRGTDTDNVDTTNRLSFSSNVERHFQAFVQSQESLVSDVAFCGY